MTGLRFVKQNRMIHLQVQESQLMQFGKVNSSTTHWVPVSQFKMLDKGIKDGIDYHTLTFEKRQIDFDDLSAPIGHVIVRNLGLTLTIFNSLIFCRPVSSCVA